LKGKEVNLPKLGGNKAQGVVDQEKENRDLMFEQEYDNEYDNNGHDFGD